MQELFASDNFAYTLLGSKPLSWASYQKPCCFNNWKTFCDSFSTYNRMMHDGWKTWEKYSHLFLTENFWREPSTRHSGVFSILLVNAETFNQAVIENKNDFQHVLHREVVDGRQLLREAKHNSLMSDILQGHQALMGIVLGYGKENAWKFLKGSAKRQPIGWVWDETTYFGGQSLEFLPGSSLTDYYLSHYSCPSFAGDPNSEESLQLKKEYLLTKREVLNYYQGKDFLEATLSLLAGYRP